MKRTCKCPPGSPFHWKDDPRPSIFVDRSLKASETSSASQTAVVERMRQVGVDISFIPGLSNKADARPISMRQFTTYSKAVPKT